MRQIGGITKEERRQNRVACAMKANYVRGACNAAIDKKYFSTAPSQQLYSFASENAYPPHQKYVSEGLPQQVISGDYEQRRHRYMSGPLTPHQSTTPVNAELELDVSRAGSCWARTFTKRVLKDFVTPKSF